jgi:hypothetical protein
MKAASSTTASTTGASWLSTALSVTVPRPGRPNTFSVMTAPPSRPPMIQPPSVTTGSAACRSTCRRRSRSSPRPRARTVTTKGCSSARSIASRSTCASRPAVGSASAVAGSTSARQSAAPETGNQRSVNEKAISSRMPSQNTGVEANTSSSVEAAARAIRPRPEVSVATTTANSSASTPAASASSTVGHSCAITTRATGWRSSYEVPKSPLAMRARKPRYCSHSGRSNPHSAAMASRRPG